MLNYLVKSHCAIAVAALTACVAHAESKRNKILPKPTLEVVNLTTGPGEFSMEVSVENHGSQTICLVGYEVSQKDLSFGSYEYFYRSKDLSDLRVDNVSGERNTINYRNGYENVDGELQLHPGGTVQANIRLHWGGEAPIPIKRRSQAIFHDDMVSPLTGQKFHFSDPVYVLSRIIYEECGLIDRGNVPITFVDVRSPDFIFSNP